MMRGQVERRQADIGVVVTHEMLLARARHAVPLLHKMALLCGCGGGNFGALVNLPG